MAETRIATLQDPLRRKAKAVTSCIDLSLSRIEGDGLLKQGPQGWLLGLVDAADLHMPQALSSPLQEALGVLEDSALEEAELNIVPLGPHPNDAFLAQEAGDTPRVDRLAEFRVSVPHQAPQPLEDGTDGWIQGGNELVHSPDDLGLGPHRCPGEGMGSATCTFAAPRALHAHA